MEKCIYICSFHRQGRGPIIHSFVYRLLATYFFFGKKTYYCLLYLIYEKSRENLFLSFDFVDHGCHTVRYNIYTTLDALVLRGEVSVNFTFYFRCAHAAYFVTDCIVCRSMTPTSFRQTVIVQL